MNSNASRSAGRGIRFALANCFIFVVLTLVAMYYYPGGTHTDHQAEGYSFWHNFFSDLGMWNSFTGDPKFISFILFVTALSLIGLSFISFSVCMPSLFHRLENSRKYISTGSFFGFIAGISFIGVAFTPRDLCLVPHIIFVFSAFICFLLVVIFYSIGILKDHDYPNSYAFIFMGFAVLLASYIILLFLGPGSDEQGSVVIQAAGQKVIVYAAIITMSVQAFGALKFIRKYF